LKGCPAFGETENLRSLIKRSITSEDFEIISRLNKKVIFTVSNLTEQTVEYIHSDKCNYDDFCDWAWASTNFVPYECLPEEWKPICRWWLWQSYPGYCALENYACEVDVIILENEHSVRKQPLATNAFSLLLKTFRFMATQISIKDLIIGKLLGVNRKTDIRIYYTPRELTDNSLIFDPIQMKQWWEDGFEYARNNEPFCYCHQPGM